MPESEIAATLIELERRAMDRWAQGDPDGFLELSDPEVSYFDPFVERRLDGLDALRNLYERMRGQVRIDSFEFIQPRVQVAGDGAVLSFHFRSSGSDEPMLWNTTEVYRRTAAGWRIVHTHWAFHRPQLATPLPGQASD